MTSITEIYSPSRVFEGIGTNLRSLCDVTTFGVTRNLEWDEAKNRTNIRKHGFDFAWLEEMFRGLLLVRPDLRHEERRIGIGMIQGRCAFAAFAEPAPDTIRIISLRKATHKERKGYEKALQNGPEAD